MPALRYHLEQAGISQDPVPPDWYFRCFRGDDAPFCRTPTIAYGAWIRPLTFPEKQAAILAALPAEAATFWFLVAHPHPEEMDPLLSIWDSAGAIMQRFEVQGAALYEIDRERLNQP